MPLERTRVRRDPPAMAKPFLPVAVACLLGGGAAYAAPASDPATPPFPAGPGEAATMLWLKQHTSLGVGRHVVFGPDNVVVVTADEPGATPALHEVAFRQEATRIDFVGRTGGRSLKGDGEVDCTAGAFRPGVTELYAGSDLKGPLIQRVAPAAEAQRPAAGATRWISGPLRSEPA